MGGKNFCQVTGQPNWCSSSMPCHHDPNQSSSRTTLGTKCPVANWCVCQWAFASYIHNAGGCDYIQEIKCEAINLSAYRAYGKMERYREALECLNKRCCLNRLDCVKLGIDAHSSVILRPGDVGFNLIMNNRTTGSANI